MGRIPATLLFLSLAAAPAHLAADSAALTILHTNDTHGRLHSFRYAAAARNDSELEGLPRGVELGGIARRATLVCRIRDEQAARGVPVWLVDAGDFMDGTAFSVEYRGRADLDAMAAAGYTLGVLGNHELNLGLHELKALTDGASFPILSANIFDRSSGRPFVTPSLVRRVGPLRIGVFGLVTRDAADYPAAREGLRVADEVATARRVTAELRRRADIVILVSHAGRTVDELIAARVPDIDVIVGGHSHSRLPSGELIWRGETRREDDVGGTVVVQAHQWGGELGRLDLHFARDERGRWHVARYRATLIPVTAAIPEDARVAAVVERYWTPIAARQGEVLARAADGFVSRGRDQAEYNLMADAMRAALGTEVHLENQGGVRAPLLKGPVTRADLAMLDPFDNTLVTFRITGADLLRLLAAYTPAVSGLRYRVEDGVVVEATVGGRPLSSARVYSASTNSYFARKALSGLPRVKLVDTGRKRRETLVDYVRGQRVLRPLYDGRRIVLP